MTIAQAPSDANEIILNRAEAVANARQHAGHITTALRSIVDYGTHLIPRCWTTSQRELTDIVVLAVMLKQIVGLLDAAEVLISAGCVQPALLPLRATYEAVTYLDWMLLRDTDRRAKAYHVANIRRGLRWAKRVRRGTKESKALLKEMRSLGMPDRFKGRKRQLEVAAEVRRYEELLNQQAYRRMSTAFERRKRGLYDPEWYVVLFPRKKRPSLYTLAKQLKRPAEYRLIYETGSEMMHSSRSDRHFRVENGKLGFHSLRELGDIGQVAQLLMGQAMRAYTSVLRRYRPHEVENFARKYATDWRRAYLTPVEIQYEYVERELG
jgi:hypothetical protein